MEEIDKRRLRRKPPEDATSLTGTTIGNNFYSVSKHIYNRREDLDTDDMFIFQKKTKKEMAEGLHKNQSKLPLPTTHDG